MALTVKELMNAVRTSEDFQKRGAMVRRFIVTTKDPKAAKQADGIPATRSAHPDDPSYLLDSKSTSSTGNGFTYVDCEYSNDRRGYPRNPNKDVTSWYHWGWAMRDAEIPYYVNVKNKVRFSDQSDPVDLWELTEQKLLESRLIRPLYVRLEKVSDIRWLDPIRQQKNKVHHMPDGVWYRFLGADVTQVDDYTFDVKYEWEMDEGTLMPTTRIDPSVSDRVNIPHDSFDGDYLRWPYYRLAPLASDNPRTTPHSTFQLAEYVNDEYGWRTLPGANRVI